MHFSKQCDNNSWSTCFGKSAIQVKLINSNFSIFKKDEMNLVYIRFCSFMNCIKILHLHSLTWTYDLSYFFLDNQKKTQSWLLIIIKINADKICDLLLIFSSSCQTILYSLRLFILFLHSLLWPPSPSFVTISLVLINLLKIQIGKLYLMHMRSKCILLFVCIWNRVNEKQNLQNVWSSFRCQ